MVNIIIIIIIKTFKVLIKKKKGAKLYKAKRGNKRSMSAGIFQNWKFVHPVNRTFENFEKKGVGSSGKVGFLCHLWPLLLTKPKRLMHNNPLGS